MMIIMIVRDRLHKKTGSETPIWMMRQAGRYLPEYWDIRNQYPNFMEFCYTPDASVEVTLQPIQRFDFDAAIIFSDILVIPDALGQRVSFRKDYGPILEGFRLKHIHDLDEERFVEHLSPVYEAIAKTRDLLSKNKALYGFAGSPWTLSCYMVEEGKSQDFKEIKRFSRSFEYRELLKTLTHAVALHASEQIKAGANVVQIFDSWALMAPSDHIDEFIISPFIAIATYLHTHHPGIPVVYYGRCEKEVYFTLSKAIEEQLPNAAIGLGGWQGVNLEELKEHTHLPLQGNLDPDILLQGGRDLDEHIETLMQKMKGHPHIFNLGHGINKETPIEHVHHMVNRVRTFKA